MARIRTIKPEFFQDERLARASRDARFLFAGLISMSDDHGRLRGHPMFVRSFVFPYDSDVDVPALLDELAGLRRIQRYESGGESFIWLPKFTEHQRIDKPSDSKIPVPPPFLEGSENPPRGLQEGSKMIPGRKGREGKGEEGNGSTAADAAGAAAVLVPPDSEPDGPDELQRLWNELAPPQLPRWKAMPKDRKAAAKARLKETPLRELRAALERLATSPFLLGQGGRGWRADPDWFLKPGSAAKILEGKYGDTGPPPSTAPPCTVEGCEYEARFSLSDSGPPTHCETHRYQALGAARAS